MEDIKEQKVTELGCVRRLVYTFSTLFSIHCLCECLKKQKNLELWFNVQVVWSMKRVLCHKSVSKDEKNAQSFLII